MSLDVFRGLTIAGMILVNNPGTWSAMYKPLGHAQWDGWTPTDFIFPFFLFIVGVAMTFSFDKRLAKGVNRAGLFGHVFCRACVLYLLGMILTGFPNFRLITPYILAIVGLEILLEIPSRHPDAPRSRMVPVAWLCIVAAVAWFAVDFRYFNGPTQRSAWSHFFPLAAGTEGSPIRVVGVLQRIALCYVAASLIMMFSKGAMARIAWVIGLIVAYWAVMKFIDAPAGFVIGAGVEGAVADAPPDAPFPGRLNDWIDTTLLGGHLYKHRPDPEGLLSTIPAISTTLFGVLTGMWLHSPREKHEKASGLFALGLVLLVVAEFLDAGFPINKKNWSSSYVVAMAGWANLFFALCYYAVDIRGWRKWAVPALVFGTNAIAAFFASGIMARVMGMIKWGEGDQATNLRNWLYSFFPKVFESPNNASLAWALCFVGFWLLILTPLYRKRIFIKV